MTTAEQIDLWRNNPSEDQRLEFKEAKQNLITENSINIVWLWRMKGAATFCSGSPINQAIPLWVRPLSTTQ